MKSDSQYSLESNEFLDSKNNSMAADSKNRLNNVKSKVDKAISCSKLLLEIHKENLKKIDNTKDNETIVELVNNNKHINATDLIVRNYILDELQIIVDNLEDKEVRTAELEKIIKKLQSELKEENKDEIADELNAYILEINNIELALKTDVDLINEYKRYATYITTRTY